MVTVALCIPVLVWYAADAILNSTDGELRTAIDDPAAPGFEIRVDPSPSHMALNLTPDGQLSSVVVMSVASNDMGGTALFLAAETLVAGGDRRLLDVYAAEGDRAARSAVAALMDVDVNGHTVLDAPAWAQVVAPAAPVTVELQADLVAADGAVAWPVGAVEIPVDQTAEFLGWMNPGEGSQGRVQRQLAFWNQWVDVLSAADDASAMIPGELGSGFSRMIGGLANGQAVLTSITGVDVEMPDGSLGTQINVSELRGLVHSMIPFPRPVEPGARPRVRLLDGVGTIDEASLYAPRLIAAGAQVIILGNAPSFGVAETVVIYHAERYEALARAFSDELGGAVVQFDRVPEADTALDMTIIIGEDRSEAVG